MKTIEITLEAFGDITQLPDSQKIFGSLVFLFSKVKGNEETKSFIDCVCSDDRTFMLSSLLPKGYFPMPKVYLTEQLGGREEKKDECQTSLKELYTKIKSMDYIPKNKVMGLWQDWQKSEKAVKCLEEKLADLENDFIKLEYNQQQRVGIENELNGIPTFQNNLYSIQKVRVMHQKKSKDTQEKKQQREFSFLINIDDDAPHHRSFCDMLKQASEQNELLLLGRRTTQGNNVYQIKGYEEKKCDTKEASHYLNIGKLIPNAIEYKKSYLELFTSERKPYHMDTAMDKSVVNRCFISFIEEGGIICKSKETTAYNIGKSIANPFNVGTIVFGNSFLYPLNSSEVIVNE